MSTEEITRKEAPLVELANRLGIELEIHRHPPVMTVEEAKALRGDLAGAHVKNLFLRDRKRRPFLVTVDEDRPLDLKALGKALGAKGGLSFGSAELLKERLGVEPGSVTPLAVIHDVDEVVTLVLDASLMSAERIFCHPLHNEATLGLTPADLKRICEATNHPPILHPF